MRQVHVLHFDSVFEQDPGTGVDVWVKTPPTVNLVVQSVSFQNLPDAFQYVERPRKGDFLHAQRPIKLRIWLTRPARVHGTIMAEVPAGHTERTCVACGRSYFSKGDDQEHECERPRLFVTVLCISQGRRLILKTPKPLTDPWDEDAWKRVGHACSGEIDVERWHRALVADGWIAEIEPA